LRGRVPVHAGHGPGLSERRLGSRGGSEQETLTVNQLPSHSHPLQATTAAGNSQQPGGKALAPSGSLVDVYVEEPEDPVPMASTSIGSVGGSRSHTNLQPFLCVHFIIALVGIYPSRH
jgi:microcystin-dependent protein